MLTIVPAHWAVEWVRPVTPNFRMVGPLLPRPAQPLPQECDVSTSSSICRMHDRPSCSE